MNDFKFALATVAAVFVLFGAIVVIANRNDAQAIKACAARGGKYVRGHGIELCVDPRALR